MRRHQANCQSSATTIPPASSLPSWRTPSWSRMSLGLSRSYHPAREWMCARVSKLDSSATRVHQVSHATLGDDTHLSHQARMSKRRFDWRIPGTQHSRALLGIVASCSSLELTALRSHTSAWLFSPWWSASHLSPWRRGWHRLDSCSTFQRKCTLSESFSR